MYDGGSDGNAKDPDLRTVILLSVAERDSCVAVSGSGGGGGDNGSGSVAGNGSVAYWFVAY